MKSYILFLLIIILSSCSKSHPELNKEQAIHILNEINNNILNENYSILKNQLYLPSDYKSDKLNILGKYLISNKHISKKGIIILKKKGQFGKYHKILKTTGEKWIKKLNIPNSNSCYILKYSISYAMFCFIGNRYKLIRIKNAGLL
jgi:hypothetical protein